LVTDVLRKLTEHGVRYALLRAPATSRSDVDLLVHPADSRDLAALLQDEGFLATPSLRHWPHRFFAKFDDERWLVFDVLDRVLIRGAWLGGRQLAAELTNRCEPDADGVLRLTAEDGTWANWLHGALRPEPAPPQEATDAKAPIGCASPLAVALDARTRPGVSRRVVHAIADADIVSAVALTRALRDRPTPFSQRALGSSARWLDRSPHRVMRRDGRARGCTVALLGPDGAGKSTLAAGIREELPLPVHLIYMGVFRTDARQLAWRRIPGGGLLIRLCRLWWRSTRARYHRSRGHIVVFDRYVFDATLRPGPRGLRARLSYWLLERSCPPPDVVLLLDAPGAVMFARKKEHSEQVLEERRQHYLAMAARLKQAHVIDATMSREEVATAAAAHIWKALTSA
jgi:thymidylate kinase